MRKALAKPTISIALLCWNASIIFIKWEDGTEETSECRVCERMIGALNGE